MKFQTVLDSIATSIPAYRRVVFGTIVTGLLIGKGGGTASAIFREFGSLLVGSAVTQKRFYMFLNSGLIKWPLLWRRVADLLHDHVAVSGRLLVALDDTTYGKTGRKISGCDTHFDHAGKQNVSPWIFGHCRVVAGVLCWCHGRWACLPMAQKNFVRSRDKGRKQKIHSGLKKKTVHRRKKERREQWQKTKCGIAASLVEGIQELFRLPVLVVCDSWFGNHSLLKEWQRNQKDGAIHLLSRLRISCVLHELPEEQPNKQKKGRPRKYGRRLPKLEELAGRMRDDALTQSMHIYGRERDCSYSELVCVSKALKCVVKVVFVHRTNGRFFPLVTTDLGMTAKQMIEYYSARWKIESGFKELKHEIGALDSQCRKENAVENHFNLCCLAMTAAWLYALKQSSAPSRRHPSRRSSAFAFADVRRLIANELRTEPIISKGCPETVKRAAKLIRDKIFSMAA